MKRFISRLARLLKQKPVYSTITFAGFIFGITAGLFIYLWINNELSYEKFHPDHKDIYRVLTLAKQGNEIVKSTANYIPVAKTLKEDYPQIENSTCITYSPESRPFQINEGSEKIEGRGGGTDDNFFNIFRGFEFLEGSPEDALADPSNIVISEEFSQKLFGKNNPAIGKSLISDKYRKEIYTVGGVVRMPLQSHIHFDFVISSWYSDIAGSWLSKAAHVYIKLKKNEDIDDKFLSSITNHIGRYTSKTDKLMFQPIADIHLHSDYKTSFYDKNISSYKYVLIFSVMSLLIILMASLNFSVLSMARGSERHIEIGMKKVNGASKLDIAAQFMGESVFQTFAASLLALVLALLLLPWFNELTGQQIVLNFSLGMMISLFLITLGVGIVSGFYPSIYLSSFSPMSIFRGKIPTGSRADFIRILSTVQFAIAIFFIIATTVFIRQMDYIQNKDLGFSYKNIIVVPTGLWYHNKSFKDELLKNPNVLGVTASTYAPLDYGWKTKLPYTYNGLTDSVEISYFFVDEDFAKTYNLNILKGEFIKMDYSEYWNMAKVKAESEKAGDKHTLSTPVVINETAEKILGFDDPIGQRIGNNVIVGVVKDFHFRPLHQAIEPLLLINNPENIMTMNIHISPENRAEAIEYVSETYKKHRDSRGFSYRFFDDMMLEKYQSEIRLRNLTSSLAILAIVIAVLGILGMSYFSCDRRTKEIGIRKVNGAKTWEVMAMLNKDFVKWVVISFIIASPVAWYFMDKWLENFAYKTELSWWIFALAGLLAMGIALLTVSWQSWRAATRNPVEALRYE
jgi:putative ABC transport system permease protein